MDLEPDYIEGEILLFDKPLGWTSFQLVKKVRWTISQKLGIKKLKVGHAGTLDPLATGLMILATGKKTKQLQGLTGLSKSYSGTFTMGATRPSYDKETEVDATFPTDHITEELARSKSKMFLGEQEQTPPVFSAKKIDGKRAYEHARKGQEVKMRKSLINIEQFEITNVSLPEVAFYVNCSKGTYIRSLAHDFGNALDSGAYLSSLRRESIGDYNVQDAFEVDSWLESM